jgi:hypothetical protein
MPCLLGCLAIAAPRLVIVLLVIFTNYIGRAFNDAVLWPLLGFVFLPLTTLAYAWVINTHGQISGVYVIVMILAILFDLGLLGGSGASGRKYQRASRK